MEKDFRTVIDLKSVKKFELTHSTPILSLGSCFAVEIGNHLAEDLFNIMLNPFGALFNPVSVEHTLRDILSCRTFTEEDIFWDDVNALWHSFHLHSSFSHTDSHLMLENINSNVLKAHEILLSPDNVIIITLGSSRGFRYKPTGKIVANCHKLPSNLFEIVDFTIEEVIESLNKTIKEICQANPSSRFIISVSPVRHISYGLHEDKLSKATLLLAVDRLTKDFENVSYFPAYEIMMDDLRDYRFYETDMVHPSSLAVDYIYDKFLTICISGKEAALLKSCRDLIKRKRHRLINPDSNASKDFLRKTKAIEKELVSQYPHIEYLLKAL